MKSLKFVLAALCCCFVVYVFVYQRYVIADAQSSAAVRHPTQCGDRTSSSSDAEGTGVCAPTDVFWAKCATNRSRISAVSISCCLPRPGWSWVARWSNPFRWSSRS